MGLIKPFTERYSLPTLRTIDLSTFEPIVSELPSLAELLQAAEVSLEEIRDIAEDEDWLWNPDNMNGESSGWNQTEGTIEDQIMIALAASGALVSEQTEKLVEEEEEPAWWIRATAETIVEVLYILFLLGIGGRSNVSDGDEVYIRDRARRQLIYLRNFAGEIVDGNLSANQINARIQYYINEARLAYDESLRRAYAKEGWNWERSVLSIAEHCPGCVRADAEGWVPIGTQVPLGSRDCKFNDKCHWQYSRSEERPTDAVPLMWMRYGWL